MNKSTYIIIFLLAFLKSFVFSHFGLNFFDYGETLHNAQRLVEGGYLYRDVWAFFPPADNLFPALIFQLFGQNLLIVRYIESLFFGILIIVIIKIMENIITKKYSYFLAFALIFINENAYLFFYQVFFYIGIFFCVLFLRSKRGIVALYFSGTAVGIGMLFRHDHGLMFLISIFIVLILKLRLKSLKPIFVCSLGVTTVITPVLYWMLFNKILTEFLYLAFIKAPIISRILSPYKDVLNIYENGISISAMYSTYTLLVYFIYILIYPFTLYFYSKEGKDKYVILLILIVGLMHLPYAFSIIDMGHLMKAGVPAVILGVYLTQKFERNTKNYLYLFPISIFILFNIAIQFWWLGFNDDKVYFSKGSININSKYKEDSTHVSSKTLKDSVEFIEKNSDENDYILAVPYHAMLYYLSDRKSPSKFNNIANGFLSKEEELSLIRSLNDKNVEVIIYDPINGPHNKKMSEYYPELHSFIMNEYRILEISSEGWLFMLKRE